LGHIKSGYCRQKCALSTFWQSVAKYCRPEAFFKQIREFAFSRSSSGPSSGRRGPAQKFFDAIAVRV
jgi:hypothetical protein